MVSDTWLPSGWRAENPWPAGGKKKATRRSTGGFFFPDRLHSSVRTLILVLGVAASLDAAPLTSRFRVGPQASSPLRGGFPGPARYAGYPCRRVDSTVPPEARLLVRFPRLESRVRVGTELATSPFLQVCSPRGTWFGPVAHLDFLSRDPASSSGLDATPAETLDSAVPPVPRWPRWTGVLRRGRLSRGTTFLLADPAPLFRASRFPQSKLCVILWSGCYPCRDSGLDSAPNIYQAFVGPPLALPRERVGL